MAQHGKVLGSLFGANPTVVFSKQDIKDPMERIFHPPMFPYGLNCVASQGSDVK